MFEPAQPGNQGQMSGLVDRLDRARRGDRAAVLEVDAAVQAAAELASVWDVEAGRAVLGTVAELFAFRARFGDGHLDVIVTIAAVEALGGPQSPGVPPGVGRFIVELRRLHPAGVAALARPAHWCDWAVDLPLAGEPEGDPAAAAVGTALLRLAMLALPAGDVQRTVVLVNLCGRLLREHRLGAGRRQDGADRLDQAVEVAQRGLPGVSGQDPRRALLLVNAGLTWSAVYERDGEIVVLKDAIAALRAAVAAAIRPQDEAMALSNLGLMVRTRGERTGRAADLAEAVALGSKALALTAPGDADRRARLTNLATALLVLFERTGEPRTLAEAVVAAERAADGCPPGDPHYAMIQANLGGVRYAQHRGTGKAGSLAGAISALRAAVGAASDGSPERAGHLSSLCLALHTDGERTGSPALLMEAVRTGRQAVDEAPSGGLARLGYLSNYGNACHAYAERTGDLASLQEAVRAAREVIDRIPADHPDLVQYLSNLGIALQTRYERTDDIADLTEAIQVGRRAVQLTPTDHPNKALYLSNLSLALQASGERTGSVADLGGAIDTGRAAVESTPQDHPALPQRWSNLALALRMHFETTGTRASLDAAIEAARRSAVAVSPQDAQSPGWLSNLSLALRLRGELTNDAAVLAEAVEAAAAAVAATPEDHPDRAGFLSNLGSAQLATFERTGDRALLNAAVATARESLTATPDDHPDRMGYLSNLSNALHVRHERFGGRDDLDEAIDTIRQAVSGTPIGHGDRPSYLSNLVGALHSRYTHHGELASLHEAIDAGWAALASTAADHPQRPLILHNLGYALQARFERTGVAADLVDALDVGQQAVEATSLEWSSASQVRVGLANGLMLNFTAAADQTSLCRAVELYREAIARTPDDHPDRVGWLGNLSIALTSRHESTGEHEPLQEAIEAAEAAVAAVGSDDADRAVLLYVLANAMETRQTDLTDVAGVAAVIARFKAAARIETAAPTLRARAGAAWGRLATAAGEAQDGVAGLSLAVEALQQVAPRELARDDQEHRLAQLSGIAADAAASAAAHGDHTSAVRLLEQGRGILLAQALGTRTDLTDLRRHEPALAARFEELLTTLDDVPTSLLRTPGAVAGERRVAAVAELDRVVDQIHRRPRFRSFLRPPDIDSLLAVAAAGPIVLVNVSTLGSHAFVVTTGGVDAVELPELDPGGVDYQVAKFRTAVDTALDTAPGSADRGAAESVIHEILGWLWDGAAEPVLEHLGWHRPPEPGAVLPRLWWSATGMLSLLPLHAAGHHRVTGSSPGPTMLDRAVCSYTPTLRALDHARRPTAGDARSAPDGSCLMVGMANTADRPGLPGARTEQGVLAEMFDPLTVLAGAAATPEAVLQALPAHRWAHFACHAYADLAHPSASRLVLHRDTQRPLTVAEISRLRLDDAQLAYLSACETARTGPVLTDEVIHLASAFQLAGYRQVVATLWPLADRLAVRVARDIYGALAGSGPAEAAQAVHDAAVALRLRWPDYPTVWATHVHSGS